MATDSIKLTVVCQQRLTVTKLSRAVCALEVFLLRVRPQMDRQLSFRPELFRTETALEVERLRVNRQMAFEASSGMIIFIAIHALVDSDLAAVASLVIRQGDFRVEAST